MESNRQDVPNEVQSEKPKPIICGFWRRLFAFIIDGSILGIVGASVGTLFYDPLAELGGWGRLLGFAVALFYFGLLNSSIGSGQTIGKRILKIKVVDCDKKNISVPLSFFRFMILGIPYFLNGAMLPPEILSNTFISLLLGVVVFFGCGAIVYLFIFNRESRQSLHDLITGTYVVNSNSEEELPGKLVWKGHLAVVSTLFIAIIIVMTFVIPKFSSKEPFTDLLAVQKHIQKSGLVHVATVTSGISSGTNTSGEGKEKWETTYFSINAALRHRPSDYDAIASQIALIILETYPAVIEKDALVINTSYGYDIGIASVWRRQRVQHTPQDWKELLMQPDTHKPDSQIGSDHTN